MALLAWSGGCDSTKILIDLLKSNQSAGSPLNATAQRIAIRTVAFNNLYLEHNKQQRTARNILIKKLNKLFKKPNYWTHYEIDLDWGGCTHHNNGGLTQPIMWIPTLAILATTEEPVYLGYVREDDIWHYRTEIFELWRILCIFLYKQCKLELPLEWSKKSEIIKELRAYNVCQYCWYCEHPIKSKPCGNCGPCKRHTLAEIYK